MNETPRAVTLQNAKNAGRDLMPIIVIFGFAIIMTVVTITFSRMLREMPEEPMPTAVLDKNFSALMRQGESEFARKNYEDARRIYESALSLAQKKYNAGVPLLQVELKLRLAEIESALGDQERCQTLLDEARQIQTAAEMKWDFLFAEIARQKGPAPAGEEKK